MAWKRLIFLFLFLSSIVEAKEFNLKKIISLDEPWGSSFVSDTELLITEKIDSIDDLPYYFGDSLIEKVLIKGKKIS